jgi:CubicO group peptidase (beta-lactamase class C family)
VATDYLPIDGWVTSEPSSRVDAEQMDSAIAVLASQSPNVGNTTALLVVHNGQIVREMYGPDVDAETTLISWSIAKTITQALVGMAVADGLLSLDQINLFPEWENDERSGITLRHLLNMSSGLEWREDYIDDASSDVIDMLFGDNEFSGDHAAYAIAKTLDATPGTKYLYSSGTTNIVTRLLARALGELPNSSDAMNAFMRSRLFGPLGMTSAKPRFDASGNFVGSSYVYATARDFARFGLLYLNDGAWGDREILTHDWVQFAGTFFAHDDENGFDYGGHMWISPDDKGSMLSLGYQGQHIWISPHRNLVLVRLGVTDASIAPNLHAELLRIVRSFPHERALLGNDGTSE